MRAYLDDSVPGQPRRRVQAQPLHRAWTPANGGLKRARSGVGVVETNGKKWCGQPTFRRSGSALRGIPPSIANVKKNPTAA